MHKTHNEKKEKKIKVKLMFISRKNFGSVYFWGKKIFLENKVSKGEQQEISLDARVRKSLQTIQIWHYKDQEK